MKKSNYILLVVVCVAIFISCKQKSTYQGQDKVENAPPDAYLNGSKHPYYGSENAWNMRFFSRKTADKLYNRRGQRQIFLLMQDSIQDAEKYCRELIKEDTNDLESYFNLAAALAHQYKIDEAMKIVKESVEKGLPFGRYLAGPKYILKPLVESEQFSEYAKNFKIEILHGPMLGRVTDNSASFWVRTVNEADVQVKVSENKNFKSCVESNVVKSKLEDAYTAIAFVDNLEPDKQYFYELYVNGKQDPERKVYSFKTFPKAEKKTKFTIAFGGCAGYVYYHEKIWNTIKGHNPLAFLWTGDNVYINEPTYPGAMHDYSYSRRQSRPEFRNLVSSTSNYAIWDDHDAATDDIWLGPYKDKPAWKMSLLSNFENNWINPFYGTQEWPGTYFNFTIGDVEFFMTDGRFYRTNPYDDNPTMLGPNQKLWLLEGIKKSKATFKVLISGTPWAFDAKADSRDTWNGFRKERKEIFDFLADNKISGVVLLSGDRHRTDIRKIERPNGYPLYDWENCKLTNVATAKLVGGAIFEYNKKNIFGILKFDTKAADPTVTFEPMSIDDEKLYSMTLSLSELSHK